MTETTLQFTREIEASANSVWRCWTEPELLMQWFTPKPVQTTKAIIEPTPGGRFDTTMVIPDMPGPISSEGCVLAAEPGQRFAFTNMMTGGFQPQDTSGEGQFPFSADIAITASDSGCTYSVVVRHLDAAGADAHRAMGFFEGWGTAADQMVVLAATLD